MRQLRNAVFAMSGPVLVLAVGFGMGFVIAVALGA